MPMQEPAVASDATDDRRIVSRLFDLACNGDMANAEFRDLDRRVRERLLQVYGNPAPED